MSKMRLLCFLLIPAMAASFPFFNGERNDEFENLLKQAIAKFQKDVAIEGYFQMIYEYHGRIIVYAGTELEYNVEDIKLYHLEEAQVQELKADDGKVKFSVFFPQFNATSHYIIDGSSPRLIQGNGMLQMGWKGMLISGFIDTKISKTEVQIDKISLEYDFQDIYFHIDGLNFLRMSEDEYNKVLFGHLPGSLKRKRKWYAALASMEIKKSLNRRLKNVTLEELMEKLRHYVEKLKLIEEIQLEFLDVGFDSKGEDNEIR